MRQNGHVHKTTSFRSPLTRGNTQRPSSRLTKNTEIYEVSLLTLELTRPVKLETCCRQTGATNLSLRFYLVANTSEDPMNIFFVLWTMTDSKDEVTSSDHDTQKTRKQARKNPFCSPLARGNREQSSTSTKDTELFEVRSTFELI